MIIILLFSAVLEEAEKIAQFAEDNIPFDAQMKSLKDALDSKQAVKIEKVISEAKQSAAEMLEYKGYYKGFCQYLLLEKGLLRKGDRKIFHTVYMYYTMQKKVTQPIFVYLLMVVI
jgi:hypothetical protein